MVREKFYLNFLVIYNFFGDSDGDGRSKSFEPLFFALKQSKANKCQCAERLKTVKKFLFIIFLRILEKMTQKFQK